jgi:hypothetical protein
MRSAPSRLVCAVECSEPTPLPKEGTSQIVDELIPFELDVFAGITQDNGVETVAK